jgi:hypothetical protein
LTDERRPQNKAQRGAGRLPFHVVVSCYRYHHRQNLLTHLRFILQAQAALYTTGPPIVSRSFFEIMHFTHPHLNSSGNHPDALRRAGFDVRCFRDDFHYTGEARANVKDPRVIRHCHQHNYVLVTTDKELCYTHIGTVKKTDIVVIATESNRSEISVWVNALIAG